MHFITFIFVLGIGLFAYRVTWTAYTLGKFTATDESARRPSCSCTCVDDTMTSPQLKVSVQYRGPRTANRSCSCRDFLLPRIESVLRPPNVSVACEICRCTRATECTRGQPVTFETVFDIILGTVLGVCFLYCLVKAAEALFAAAQWTSAQSKQSKRRRGEYFQLFDEQLALKSKPEGDKPAQVQPGYETFGYQI